MVLFGAQPALAATYYVAADGNDGNTAAQAQNAATPWQSLAKVNASMGLLRPGDRVLLRRGDTFRGGLLVTASGSPGSPLTFGAYGATGTAAPVLNGGVPVTGWASVGPNLWEAPVPGGGAEVTNVLADGRVLPLGRYPNLSALNQGYLPITAHTGTNQFTSAPLAAPPSGSWAGGEIVVRNQRYILDRGRIASQSGTTLTLPNGGLFLGNGDNWGFFIQRHRETLDQPGEWYYNPATRVLRVFSASSPAPRLVEATVTEHGVKLNPGTHDLVVESLTVANPVDAGLLGTDVSHLVVRDVTFRNAGKIGLGFGGGGSDLLIENNQMLHSNSFGLIVYGSYAGVTVRNNRIVASGLVAGLGADSGNGQYTACDIGNSNDVRIEGNTVDSSGYNGITFNGGDRIRVLHNVVRHFNYILDDGGAIYTYNGNSARNNLDAQVTGNIIADGMSNAAAGTPEPDRFYTSGIYLDDCTQNVDVVDNTVTGCNFSGLFIHGNTRITATGNTLYNNSNLQLFISTGGCPNTGLDVRNNILLSPALRGGRLAAFDMAGNPIRPAQMGPLAGNYYCQPFDEGRNIYTYGGRPYQLPDWQAAFGQDAGSRTSPVTFQPYRVSARTGANPVANGTFTGGIGGWYPYSDGSGQQAMDNTGRLGAGNSLRLSFGTPTAADHVLVTETDLGALQPAKRYTVRFRAACSAGTEVLEVYGKRSVPGYEDLTPRTQMRLTVTPRDYEVALVPSASDPTTRVAFLMHESARQVWLDNVVVQEATLTPASVGDSIRFEYNATAAPRPVALPAGARYVDARNAVYSGSVTLAPYASVVLLRAGAANPLAAGPAAGPAASGLRAYPNPARDQFTAELPAAGPATATLHDGLGRVVRRQAADAGRFVVDTRALPAGVYLLRVQQGRQAFAQKIEVWP